MSRSFLALVAVLAVLVAVALWFFPWQQQDAPEETVSQQPAPETTAADTRQQSEPSPVSQPGAETPMTGTSEPTSVPPTDVPANVATSGSEEATPSRAPQPVAGAQRVTQQETQRQTQQDTQQDTQQNAAQGTPEREASPQVSALPQPAAEGSDEVAAEAAGLPGPRFDVVRVERDGAAVMAGRATPNAEVVVRRDGEELARGRADARGEFVILPDRPLPSGDYVLDLEEVSEGGGVRRSADQVVLSVPDASRAQTVGEGSSAPLVVQVPRAEEGTPRVMQLPEPRPNGVAGGLWLEAVDYEADGRVVVTGAGLPDLRVLAYLDNALLGETTVDAAGRWRLAPQQAVPAGLYTLRIDQVAADGGVTARVESPFARAAFDTADLPSDARFVVIQPGNNLWTIARRTYGEGTRFTVIFEANEDQIRDPDLIYPGQIFVLPPERG